MTLDWRIQTIMHAHNTLCDVKAEVPDYSPAHTALVAAVLATEIAWNELESDPERYPEGLSGAT